MAGRLSHSEAEWRFAALCRAPDENNLDTSSMFWILQLFHTMILISALLMVHPDG